jgi:glycosyltransferase involved in cell wall biosynthesis
MQTQMSEPKTVSVIISWSNRPEIEMALALNAPEFDSVGAEVMVVNCGGDGAMLGAAIKRSGYQDVRRIDIPASKFNKCLAINLGVHLCRGKVLFLLDTDMILDAGFLKAAVSLVSAVNYVTVERVVEKEAKAPTPSYLTSMSQKTEFTCRDGKIIRFEHERLYFDDNSRVGYGQVVMRKEDFHAIGGMHSQMEGWGYEDQDLHLRLNAVQGLSVVRVGRATHLTHGDNKRSLEGGTTKSASHKLNVAIGYDNYARGNFIGTYSADVAQWAARISEQDAVTDEVLSY